MRLSVVLILLLTLAAPVGAQTGPNLKPAEPFKVGTFELHGVPHVCLVLRDSLVVDIEVANVVLQSDPAYVRMAPPRDMLELISSRPIPRDDLTSTVAGVVRSGKPALRRRIRQESIQGAHGGSVMRLYNRLAPRSALVVPLVSGPAVFGTLSLCYSHSGRSYARSRTR